MAPASRHPPVQIAHSCPQPPGIESLAEWCTLAGHFWSHTHRLEQRAFEETVLIHCVGGRGWVRVDKEEHAVTAGDVFCCPARVEHGYGCDPETGWEILWLHGRGRHTEALVRAAGLTAEQPVCRPARTQSLAATFNALLLCLGRNDNAVAWEAAEHLHRLLVDLVRQHTGPAQAEGLAALIDVRCRSLDELAKHAGYSKYHFCRLFKAQTGRSPWQVVLERKVERARELLLSTRLPIREIAKSLGFDNADYFARLFARHTGVTPRAYRGG